VREAAALRGKEEEEDEASRESCEWPMGPTFWRA
jgi:hypothetical protein